MSESLSRDHLRGALILVSELLHLHRLYHAEESSADEAGSKVRVKTEVYQEVLKSATPSEEVVRLLLGPLAPSKNNVNASVSSGKIGSRGIVNQPTEHQNDIRSLYTYPGCIL